MSEYKRPLAISDDGKTRAPMQDGKKFLPALVPVNPSRDNLLSNGDSGLGLYAKNLVSAHNPNALSLAIDSKLYVDVAKLLDPEEKVIGASDNALKTSFGLLYERETGWLTMTGSGDAEVAKVKLPMAPGLLTVAEILKDYQPEPSEEGWVESPYPVSDYLHLRFRMANGKEHDVYIDVSKLVDAYESGNTIIVDGNTINVRYGHGLRENVDDGKLEVDTPALVQPSTAAAVNALASTAMNKFKVMAAKLVNEAAPGLLTAQPDNTLSTAISLQYDEQSNELVALNANAVEQARTTLYDYWNTPSTIEILQDFAPNANSARGTWMKITWRSKAGRTKTSYFNVDLLTDRYTGGDGIVVTGTEIAVKPMTDRGIEVSEDGVAVKIADLISENTPNALVSNDNRLWIDATYLTRDSDKLLKVQDNRLFTNISIEFDTVSNMLVLRGRDGVAISKARLPFIPGLPVIAEVVHDFTPPDDGTGNPLPEGTYMHLAFELADGTLKHVYMDVTSLVDAYEGVGAVEVDKKTISLRLGVDGGLKVDRLDCLVVVPSQLISESGDSVLTVDKYGQLFVQELLPGFGLTFDALQHRFNVNLEAIVEGVEENGISYEDGGLFIQDVYKEKFLGPGLASEWVDGVGNILKVVIRDSPDNILTFDAEGRLFGDIRGQIKAGNGLWFNPDTMAFEVKPKPGGGITASAYGVSVNAAQIISQDAGNALRQGQDGKFYVKDTFLTDALGDGLELAPDGSRIDVSLSQNEENILEFDGDGSLFARGYFAGNGLSIGAENHVINPVLVAGGGLGVRVDGLYVDKKWLIYNAQTNAIYLRDGLLFAKNVFHPTQQGVGIKTDENGHLCVKIRQTIANALTVDDEGALFVGKAAGSGDNGDLIGDDLINAIEPDGGLTVKPDGGLEIDPAALAQIIKGILNPDGALVVNDRGQLGIDPEVLKNAGGGVSKDVGNLLTVGSDNKPYLHSDAGTLDGGTL